MHLMVDSDIVKEKERECSEYEWYGARKEVLPE